MILLDILPELTNLDYEGFLQRVGNEYDYLDSIGAFYYDFRDPEHRPEPLK